MDRLLTRLLRMRSYHTYSEDLGPKGIANVVENFGRGSITRHGRSFSSGTVNRLTRIRLQRAIYFCLHGGGVPENISGGQPGFWRTPPKTSHWEVPND